jgi:hypothetical protein
VAGTLLITFAVGGVGVWLDHWKVPLAPASMNEMESDEAGKG